MAKIAIQGNPAGTGTITFQPPNTNTNRTVSLPDVDGTMAVAEQASVPIGSLLWVTGTSAPAGYVAANGQLLDRATYPALWTYANGSGNIVDDVDWTTTKYSYGNGTTSFRIPIITSYDSQIACIRAYDILSNPELLNAADVVSQVNILEVAKLNKSDNIVLGASVAASNTAVDFVGIPAGVKRITVMFDGVGLATAQNVGLRLGSGSIETSGYSGQSAVCTNPNLLNILTTPASEFLISSQSTGANTVSGVITISILPNNLCIINSSIGSAPDTYNRVVFCVGRKVLSGVLSTVRLVVGGGVSFNAGTINISWEF